MVQCSFIFNVHLYLLSYIVWTIRMKKCMICDRNLEIWFNSLWICTFYGVRRWKWFMICMEFSKVLTLLLLLTFQQVEHFPACQLQTSCFLTPYSVAFFLLSGDLSTANLSGKDATYSLIIKWINSNVLSVKLKFKMCYWEIVLVF